jgi:hypothetical protein
MIKFLQTLPSSSWRKNVNFFAKSFYIFKITTSVSYEFLKKIAQNVAKHIFCCQTYYVTFTVEKSSPTIWILLQGLKIWPIDEKSTYISGQLVVEH